jgi:hypothetical protein
MTDKQSATQWVVYCPAHRHHLVHASVGGTTWTEDPARAHRFATKPAARRAAELATWLTHNPTPWPVAETTAEL